MKHQITEPKAAEDAIAPAAARELETRLGGARELALSENPCATEADLLHWERRAEAALADHPTRSTDPWAFNLLLDRQFDGCRTWRLKGCIGGIRLDASTGTDSAIKGRAIRASVLVAVADRLFDLKADAADRAQAFVDAHRKYEALRRHRAARHSGSS